MATGWNVPCPKQGTLQAKNTKTHPHRRDCKQRLCSAFIVIPLSVLRAASLADYSLTPRLLGKHSAAAVRGGHPIRASLRAADGGNGKGVSPEFHAFCPRDSVSSKGLSPSDCIRTADFWSARGRGDECTLLRAPGISWRDGRACALSRRVSLGRGQLGATLPGIWNVSPACINGGILCPPHHKRQQVFSDLFVISAYNVSDSTASLAASLPSATELLADPEQQPNRRSHETPWGLAKP
jgi:hypothetical protein